MPLALQCSRVVLGCDHAGFELKGRLIEHLKRLEGLEVVDAGCHSKDRCDYPDSARACCEEVLSAPGALGILVCGTGLGVSIAANKVGGIRCALCHDYFTAESCRKVNDANVMAVGEKTTGEEVAKQMAEVFLATAFAGGHQQARVDKIRQMEAALCQQLAARGSKTEPESKL